MKPLVKWLVLPIAVVAGVAALAWLFERPGLSRSDADVLVSQLEAGGRGRWRAAVDLANAVADPGSAELKQDRALARRLSEILRREIAAGRIGEEDATLRMYLARALGGFHVDTPLPALVEAAGTERDPREAGVRRSAVEAIAVLASNTDPSEVRASPGVMPALLEAAGHREPPVRSAAAFTLGVLGGPEAEGRLEGMLADVHPDVRYNAATGLARHGNPAAVDVLVEMLDPAETAGVETEKQEAARARKRGLILANALRATRQLAAANPSADLGRLSEAVRTLQKADVPAAVRVEAASVGDVLERR